MPYAPSSLDPSRVISDLKELQLLTGSPSGAQRVAWTGPWDLARAWEREKLSALPLTVETDPAGNQWFTLPGKSPQTLLIGGHIDSVPDGGWMDGCLNLVAGYELLRHISSLGEPPVTIKLVDWADEEARFGRSLFGSAAAAGTLDLAALPALKDRDGIALPDALAKYDLDIEHLYQAGTRLKHAAAYIELHIEQGPVLESLDLPLGAVIGTCGVERSAIRFTGQTAHAGSTPMHLRRDALAAAAKLALEIRQIAIRHGGVCTMGSLVTKPGITTAVAGQCDCTLDQRHIDASALAAMLAEAQVAATKFAGEENVSVAWDRFFHIAPILFHPELIDLADAAIRAVAGSSHRLPSGPLHDAAEISRAGIPPVMLFVQSLHGLSHNKDEDTRPDHLALAVAAFDRLAFSVMDWILSH
jgi:beta-ureidopropionase / N-carbamoyl-L-amino-acid hydrolase